jgi:peptide/nickel transport system substrate-binding protein
MAALGLAALLAVPVTSAAAAADTARRGIAMHGAPALADDFAHFPYVRPDARKGGHVRLGELGTYDSLNPYILKGVSAVGVREFVYESLLARSADEPFSLYGHLARTVTMPEDRSSVTFHLDPDARFSDGAPVTDADVVFSWQLLREKGQPFHRSHYGAVARAEVPEPGVVRFVFHTNDNRESPLLLGLMPILPKHRIDPATFDRTTLVPPVGSGPYRVAEVDTGRTVTFQRNPDWWARDKPTGRGRYNFDRLSYEYFRDQTTLFEAFKSGDVDLRLEDDAGRWADGYDFPAMADGRMQRAEVPTGWPAGMTALVFNTRRPLFADRRVREALTLLFDFEWVNRNLFHGHYTRTESFFDRSDLSSVGRPADARERQLFAPFPGVVAPAVLEGASRQPRSDGTGRNRDNMRRAVALLREAGYAQDQGRMVDVKTRKPLAFEMMAAKRAEERLFQAYAHNLAQIGIAVEIRSTDSAQRWARLKSFDFDLIQWTWAASLSPGNEQRNRWGSSSVAAQNSLNFAGVSSPAADAMIEALLAARERPEFVSAVRALDRVLLSGAYVLPLFHPKGQWLAWRSTLRRPDRLPLSGFALDTWWMDAP